MFHHPGWVVGCISSGLPSGTGSQPNLVVTLYVARMMCVASAAEENDVSEMGGGGRGGGLVGNAGNRYRLRRTCTCHATACFFPLARLLLRQFLKFVDRALPSLGLLRGREENFV